MLIGFKEDQAVVWRIFSHVVKPDKALKLYGRRTDQKALYNFHESIVDSLRPTMNEGIRSVILASPTRTSYATDFLEHVRAHHSWLLQGSGKATFATLNGMATTIPEVTKLTRASDFQKIVGQTTTEESENLLELVEKRLDSPGEEPLVLYSLEEIEDKIFGSWLANEPRPDYLLLTEKFVSLNRQKNRLQRLMQSAANKEVKVRTVKAESPVGKRLIQLGGMVCILRP